MPRAPKKVTKEQILEAFKKSNSCVQASQRLCISYRTLWEKCQQFEIEWPNYQEQGRPILRNGSKSTGKEPFRKDDGRDVVSWVDPKERDYYYNLDFLCGTYHNPRQRKYQGKELEPCHALGYGEDDES